MLLSFLQSLDLLCVLGQATKQVWCQIRLPEGKKGGKDGQGLEQWEFGDFIHRGTRLPACQGPMQVCLKLGLEDGGIPFW